MPLTSLPNGLTVQQNSAASASAGSGDLDCNRIFCVGTISAGTVTVSGQLISSSTAGIVGQYANLNFTFSTVSAVQSVSLATPFAGRIEQVYVTTGSVSAVVAGYTVQVGSAGSVAVATVSNTTASQGVQEALTTTATTFAITNALVAIRSVQGTTGDTSICVVIRKTA